MTYDRVRIFAAMDGQVLEGQHLDDEYNAVQAECARLEGLLADSGSGAVVVVDASDPAFAASGTETNAERVAAAVQAALASGSRTKVVLVPQSMWGYVADDEWADAIFDATVFMVREGAIFPFYDPVAYGADVSGAEDSEPAVSIVHLHASQSLGAGAKVVAFTVPGEYKLALEVEQNEVAVIRLPGITFTGTAMDGDVAWTFDGVTTVQMVEDLAARPATGTRDGHAVWIKDIKKLDIWDGDSWERVNPDAVPSVVAYTYDHDAVAGSRGAAVTITRVLYLRVKGTSDGSGVLTINWGAEPGLSGYSLAQLHTLTASQHERIGVTDTDTGSNGFGVSIDAGAGTVTFSSIAATDVHEFDLVLSFVAAP